MPRFQEFRKKEKYFRKKIFDKTMIQIVVLTQRVVSQVECLCLINLLDHSMFQLLP